MTITIDTPATANVDARRPAEHVLGTDIRSARSLDEALQIAGLDWGITTVGERGEGISVGLGDDERSVFMPGQKLVMRDDAPIALSMVSDGYSPMTNRVAFAAADKARDLGAVFTAAGSRDHGRSVFMTMNIPEATVKIGGKDAVEFDVVFRTSHDGRGAIQGALRGRRLACMNGQKSHLRAGSRWSVRHSESAEARLELATQTIRGALQYAKEFAALGEHLIHTPMTRDQFVQYIDRIYPRPDTTSESRLDKWKRQRDDLMGLFSTSQLQADARGTAWAAVQAVNEYDQWFRTARNDETRARRHFDGGSDQFSVEAFNLIQEMVPA